MAKIETYTQATAAGTDLLVGTDVNASNATKNFTVADLPVAGTAPASASATGVQGQIGVDASYLYVCIATDTWKRVAIATW
jgi:hypothetical protein